MMLKIKTLFITLTLLISSVLYAESDWTIDEQNWIYANGNSVNGHKFGFIKDKGRCDENLMFLNWSTYSSGLEEFKGQSVKIIMDFDGTLTHTFLELISTYKFGPMTLAMLSNVVMPEEFLDIIRNSKKLTVWFPSENQLIKALDIKKDSFDIEGFSGKFKQTQKQCYAAK